jgi:hypothetical protein
VVPNTSPTRRNGISLTFWYIRPSAHLFTFQLQTPTTMAIATMQMPSIQSIVFLRFFGVSGFFIGVGILSGKDSFFSEQ